MAWVEITHEEGIPRGEGRRVSYGNLQVALFRSPEGWFAVDNQCPHKKGSLADGIVAGKAVFCPMHNWKIDLKTGCAVAGGEGCTKSYPVKVEEGRVYIDFNGAKP